MTRKSRLVISELARDEAIALLERHHLGRLAFTFHDRVDVEPISYVYDAGWIYARTSPGTKLTTVSHHPYVAFEIDEVRGRFDWRSVVVRGTIYFLDPDRSESEAADFARAVELLQEADAGALTENDAAPFRRTVFRIHVDDVTGRAASAG